MRLSSTEIEINVKDTGSVGGGGGFEIPGMPGSAMGILNVSEMLGKAIGSDKMKQKKLSVEDALKIITSEESDKIIDEEKTVANAIYAVENDGNSLSR